MKNHYKILHIQEDATELQIRAAHRDLSRRHHPDRNGGSSEAIRRQQAINEARDVLCDSRQRASHNSELRLHRARVAAADQHRRVESTHRAVTREAARPTAPTNTSTNWWGVGLLALGAVGVLAATSNSKDEHGRFRGRDGRFRRGRWGE